MAAPEVRSRMGQQTRHTASLMEGDGCSRSGAGPINLSDAGGQRLPVQRHAARRISHSAAKRVFYEQAGAIRTMQWICARVTGYGASAPSEAANAIARCFRRRVGEMLIPLSVARVRMIRYRPQRDNADPGCGLLMYLFRVRRSSPG